MVKYEDDNWKDSAVDYKMYELVKAPIYGYCTGCVGNVADGITCGGLQNFHGDCSKDGVFQLKKENK